MALATSSGSLVKLHDILIMKLFPHLLLQVEVVVSVENEAFPVLVIVVIRVLLVALRDVAIGTHLGKMESSLGRGTKDGGSSERCRGQFPHREGAQGRDASRGSSR